jgi:hypothetical protein
MWLPEFHALVRREHDRDALRAAEHARLVAMCRAQFSLRRRLARAAGRMLLQLGLRLLRYGWRESPTIRPGGRTSPTIPWDSWSTPDASRLN